MNGRNKDIGCGAECVRPGMERNERDGGVMILMKDLWHRSILCLCEYKNTNG